MLVLTVNQVGELDPVEAQLEYHLSAGVDHVVVGRLESSPDDVRERLSGFAATDVTVESLGGPRSTARDHLRRVVRRAHGLSARAAGPGQRPDEPDAAEPKVDVSC